MQGKQNISLKITSRLFFSEKKRLSPSELTIFDFLLAGKVLTNILPIL